MDSASAVTPMSVRGSGKVVPGVQPLPSPVISKRASTTCASQLPAGSRALSRSVVLSKIRNDRTDWNESLNSSGVPPSVVK